MIPTWQTDDAAIYQGDALAVMKSLPDASVNCCVTSPPYWGLRDYGHEGQLGLEPTPEEYVAKMVAVFREVRRLLRDDGTLWLNLGDSYCSTAPGTTNSPMPKGSRCNAEQWANVRPWTPLGLKPKDLVGIPWRVAFALQSDEWYLRSDIIWSKPNAMPESVTDRPTKAHEYLFLLSKSERYYYDTEAGREPSQEKVSWRCGVDPNKQHKQLAMGRSLRHSTLGRNNAPTDGGRNRRSVWTVPTKPYKGAHFATFPPALIEPCILAGCPEGGTVLDPFNGSGTTGAVAISKGRRYIGIELNPTYIELAKVRIGGAIADVRQEALYAS